jgi:4-hydroxy-3-methylbut-2-en-1-yl diphosphate reductase
LSADLNEISFHGIISSMSADFSPVVFPEHFGFCGGVDAADQLMEAAAIEANANGVALYGLHEIVHNQDVVAKHENAGVTFVDSLAEIPPASAVVISAHGVGPEVIHAIRQNGGETIDATCPLVTHTHKGAELARRDKEKIIYVCHGKPGEVDKLHDEVAGMLGFLDFKVDEEGTLTRDPIERSYLELDEELSLESDLLSENQRYRIVSQTTLHADDTLAYREKVKAFILEHQPKAKVSWSSKGDVCRAVANRQQGVEQLVELKPRNIVVATDPGSKNGKGYVTLAERLVREADLDTEVFAVANAAEVAELELEEGLVALTASASTPNQTIHEIARALGEENPPSPNDRTLKLPDSAPNVIAQKMARLAERQRLAS